jgi:hypothetical protein
MLDTPVKFRTFTRVIVLCAIALVLIGAGFEAVPLSWDMGQIAQASQQGALAERIAKDALVMQYQTDRRADAVNELQTTLPRFESNQAMLVSSLPPSAASVLSSTAADYADIDVAAKKILNTPDKSADPVQAQIIQDHERDYFLSTSQVVNILKIQASARTIGLFVVQQIINGLLLVLGVAFLLMVERLVKRYERERQREMSET